LVGLNEQQYAAVTAGEGPVLVLAGPGSGKTGVLTRRVAYLMTKMNVNPQQILAVTFTNKAAAEMRHRIDNYLGARVRGLQIGTFHATCARILRIEHAFTRYGEDYVIFDTEDQLSAVQQALGELNIDAKKFPPRKVLSAISAAKNELILPHEYARTDYFSEVVARAYPRYQTILHDSNAMDFDDLLVEMVLMMRNQPAVADKYQRKFPFVLVDEFQDTNTVQYELVQLMGAPQNNIFVVGDEDQSIYAFRGADYRNVMRFRHDYPQAQVVLLEQNYRSSQVVLDVARAVIDRNSNRTRKALFTTRTDGEPVTIYESYDDQYEANYVMETIEKLMKRHKYRFGDFAVMYRTNAQSRALETACRKFSVPYTLVGGVGFYKRREVRDLLAYLRVINNPSDRISLARIINTPKRGIGDKSFQDFVNWTTSAEISNGEAFEKLVTGEAVPLAARSAALFTTFGEQLRRWRSFNQPGSLGDLFDAVVADTRFTFYLHEISENESQANERTENVQELRGLIKRYDEDGLSLAEFLQDQQLMTDDDLNEENNGDKITLLTLHAAKGLEYPVVFITGLEEGLLPHMRAFDEADGMEEERRLFYVGITRAKDRLYITYAFRRALFGGYADLQTRSSFLPDIPIHLLSPASTISWENTTESYRRETTWDRTPSAPTSRLANDLKSQRVTPPVSGNDAVRSKIVPFPGAKETPALKYRTGMRVRHASFGNGTVIESQGSGSSEIVTVAFEDKKFGIKKLDSEFANLTIL
jgi:DNA helicase-2/ATP-dependent DNA helicase PcrA